MAIKFAASVLIMAGILQLCSGSAIPMWEFLSRGEKMSHLYSMFAKQVSDYCKAGGSSTRNTPVAQCKRDLLTYGLERLQNMPDTHLDTMDPYQRGANELIWESIMKGHPTSPSLPSSSSSTIILAPSTSSGYEKNPLFDDKETTSQTSQSSYAMDMESYNQHQLPTAAEVVYQEPQNHLPQESATNVDEQFLQQSPSVNYLSGPMVIRVRPDGTPVEEDKYKPLPSDDDREALQNSGQKLPTIEQIAEAFRQGEQQSQSRSIYRTTQRH